MKGIAKVGLNVNFRIIIANYRNQACFPHNRQVLAHLVPPKGGVISVKTMQREMLGITEADEGLNDHKEESKLE